MSNDEQQQPDMREPSDERKAELEAAYKRQKDTDAPYKRVEIRTLGELQWIMQQRNWSGKFRLPDGMERAILIGANLSEAILTEANLGGAILTGANLSRATLEKANLSGATLTEADLGGATLTEANLSEATLTGANLIWATLTEANLSRATLTGADLSGATLKRTDLRRALMNAETVLDGIKFDTATTILGVRWNGVPLDDVGWQQLATVGEETAAQMTRSSSRNERAGAFQNATRAYHGLVVALEEQGLTQAARKFHRQERMMERLALRARPRTWGPWFFQWLLNMLSGQGENPGRAFLAYILLILGFAGIYWSLWHFGWTTENLSSPDSPFVLSLTAFHGRSFFAGGLNITDWAARVGAIEFALGLFIEIIFIATFSRRFLGD
jgi:uncharacterized protein YjbI with pentapeptide repeats